MAELQGMRAMAAPRNGLVRWARWFEPAMLLWLVLIAVLVFLVANPMVRLVLASFETSESGTPTLANYVIAYGNLRSLSALFNSLLYGVAVTLLAIVFARHATRRARSPPLDGAPVHSGGRVTSPVSLLLRPSTLGPLGGPRGSGIIA